MNNLTKEETAFLEQRTLEANKRGHEIISYWHCSKCCDEDNPQRIGVGWTPKGIQVWCEIHEVLTAAHLNHSALSHFARFSQYINRH